MISKSTNQDYVKLLDVLGYVADNHTLNDLDNLDEEMIQTINDGSGLNSEYLSLEFINSLLDNKQLIQQNGVEFELNQNGFSSAFINVYMDMKANFGLEDVQNHSEYESLNADEQLTINRVNALATAVKKGSKRKPDCSTIWWAHVTGAMIAGGAAGNAPGLAVGFFVGAITGFIHTAVKGDGCE